MSLEFSKNQLEEVPRASMATRPALEEIFEAAIRGEAILKAYRECGYTMKETTDHIGVHYATVSRRLRKQEQRRSTRS